MSRRANGTLALALAGFFQAAMTLGCDGILGIEGFEVGCGDVVVGARRCNGQQPQVCNAAGQWQDSGSACMDQTCFGGSCVGECAPGYCRRA